MSWLSPLPFDAPIRSPRQIPKVVVPSFIGDAGQVLNLLMHHGAGDVVRDYSPHGNHGRIYGATWVDGPYGWALDFDGDDYVNCGKDASIQLINNFTVEVWVLLHVAANHIVAYWDAPANHRTWRLQIYDGKFSFDTSPDGVAFDRLLSTTAVSLEVWYHVAASFLDGEAKIYVNGELENSTTYAYTSLTAFDEFVAVGSSSTPDGFLNGTVGMVRLYSKVLALDVIRRHYESTKSIYQG